MHTPGTTQINHISITDYTPLFLREGKILFSQNTSNVRSSKDLNNIFRMVIGFHFENAHSNSTHKVYTAEGTHLSVKDYNDELKVSSCVREGCEYQFNL